MAMAFAMAKDQAPSVDDLDEADLQSLLQPLKMKVTLSQIPV